jgi:hypothetical protein
VPTGDPASATWIERKPVAAAILTLSQRDDGHVTIFHEVMTAVDELEFPLPWLIEQELVAHAPTLVGDGDAALLLADAAQQRFFCEPKVAALASGAHVIDVTALAGDRVGDRIAHSGGEIALCRRLGIPTCEINPAEAGRIWTWYSPETRTAQLGMRALAAATSRMMLWANLMATCHQEPGWFYETALALRCWLDERERDAPELYAWGTAKPFMRAISFVEEYRRDLTRRMAGQESDWPRFAPGTFHT